MFVCTVCTYVNGCFLFVTSKDPDFYVCFRQIGDGFRNTLYNNKTYRIKYTHCKTKMECTIQGTVQFNVQEEDMIHIIPEV